MSLKTNIIFQDYAKRKTVCCVQFLPNFATISQYLWEMHYWKNSRIFEKLKDFGKNTKLLVIHCHTFPGLKPAPFRYVRQVPGESQEKWWSLFPREAGPSRSGHQHNFFLFPFCKKSLVCLESESMTPSPGKHYSL